MFENILATILLPAILFTTLPTDGAQLEAMAADSEVESTVYGDGGGFSHTWLHTQNVKARRPVKVEVNKLGLITSASSVVVIDDETGTLLYGERPYDLRSIGSVTKLMAVMVFLDQEPDLERGVVLNSNLDLVVGGRQYVGFGESIRLREVLAAVVVASDNSAARSLMRFSGLSNEEFVDEMNRKAIELGMGSTRFTEPTGIDPNNVSTAHQLTMLLRAAEEYDEILHYARMSNYTIRHDNGRAVNMDNTNGLLRTNMNEGAFRVVNGKTGYLPQAGYVLTSTVESRGRKIHVVVMGADSVESRVQEVRALADWTFSVYKWPDEL